MSGADPDVPRNALGAPVLSDAAALAARLAGRTLEQSRRRRMAIEGLLGSADMLAAGIARSPAPAALTRAVESAVEDNRPALARLEAAPAGVLAQYVALVAAHELDPAETFPDIAAMPGLCDQQAAVAYFKSANDQPSLAEASAALGALQRFLSNRWFALTGRRLADEPDPTLARLTDRMAPVPWRTAWSPALYRQEAERMGLAPVAAAAPAAPAPEAPADPCDIDRLYALAGAQPPRPPAAGEPRYTFPGRLNTNEDIYYDYAVVLPVDECGPFQEARTDRPRDVTAARVLAGKALQVLGFLETMNLADALGQRGPNDTVADDVRALLADVLAVAPADPALAVGSLRGRVRQMAGLLRAIAQSEMLLAPLQPQPIEDVRARLAAALAGLPTMRQVQDERINDNRNSSPIVTYLSFPGPPAHDKGEVRLFRYDTFTAPPGWSIDGPQMARHLGPYLEYLGGEFFTRIEELKSRAEAARDMLAAVQQPGTAFRASFLDLASELVHAAIFALAELLEAAAATLSLLPQERAEGSKRLAMLAIYRQHWFPAGYVQGKLVGYKNLAPGQSEKVLRRTLVKTVRETSTAAEFAATRAQENSATRRETGEVVSEMASKFGMNISASASFSVLVASGDLRTDTALELAANSRTTQGRLSEATTKTAVNWNEKRELSLRQQVETEDLVEVTTAIENRNQEITANYFYYQLLRDYTVRTELYDLRPVVLRARDLPAPAAVDAQFLSEHAHALLPVLPAQLADDMQAALGDFDPLARSVVRLRAEAAQRRLELEAARQEPVPQDAELARQRSVGLERLGAIAIEARARLMAAEERWLAVRARLGRVASHVRENICHYMQHVWAASPAVDHNRLLAEELFGGVPLPQVTRGLMRHGWYGNEEMFEFDGLSFALLDALCRTLRSGDEFMGRNAATLAASDTLALLGRKFHSGAAADLAARLRGQVFVRDPNDGVAVLDERSVQIAQDALVVETIPGQVPLLEGFKMAHRMLDVQGKCLENAHLRERIRDRPWQSTGEDSYRVYRREGEAAPAVEEEP